MPHHHELNMPDETLPSQPKIKPSWLIGTFAAFALFAVIGAYSSRMTFDYTDYDQTRAQQRYDTLAKLQKDESKLINPVDDKGNPTAEWIDQGKGLIRIPIEEAMVKEVADLKAKPMQAGNVIVVPPPPAAAKSAPTAPGTGTNAAPANAAGAPTTGATNAAPAPAAPPKK